MRAAPEQRTVLDTVSARLSTISLCALDAQGLASAREASR
jgi:hypothetical protein